ncbi:MAG: hypothetical protein QM802_13635 [Agriterribacter sp.]
MKLFTSLRHVTLDKKIAVKAWHFAKEVALTTDYRDSLQIDLAKIRIDHFKSKLGEEAVYNVLLQYGMVKPPDYNIYAPTQKSWDADLYFEGMGIAVKTMLRSDAGRYGLSWVFQFGNKRRDIIFDKPDAWIFFVECNDERKPTKEYELYVYPPYQLKELTFGSPKRKDLVGKKLVVYADMLPCL